MKGLIGSPYRLLLIFSLLHFLAASAPLVQISTEEGDVTNLIYANGTYDESWETNGIQFGACESPKMAIESSYNPSRVFTIKNYESDGVNIANVQVMSTSDVLKPYISNKLTNSVISDTMNLTITYNCEKERIIKENLNGWGHVIVSMEINSKHIEFNYLKICTMENKSPDWSIIIALVIAVLVIAFFTKVKETMFQEEAQGMDEIRPKHVAFFVVFASITLLILFFFGEYLQTIFNIFFSFSAVTSLSLLFKQ